MNVSPPTLTSSSPGSLQFRMYDAVLYVSINDREWKAIFSVPKGNTSFQMDESVPQDWSAKSTKYDRRKPAERVKADFYKVWHEYLAQQFVWAAYRHTYPPDYANAAKPWPDPEDFEIDWPNGRSVEGAVYKPWEGGARAYPEVDHFSDCAEGFKRKRNDFIFICRNPDGYPCDECGKPIEDRSNRCKWRVSDKTFKAMHYNCSWGFLQNLRPTIGGDYGVRAATNVEHTAGWWHGPREGVDYSTCPECGNDLEWGDSEQHTLKPGVPGQPEDYAICRHCGTTWTEESIEEEHDGKGDGEKEASRKQAAGFPWPVVTDMKPLARMTLEEVENWYHQNVITQDQFEAYMHVWAEDPSHAGYSNGDGWRDKNYSSPEVARLVEEFKKITGIASLSKDALGEKKAPPQVDTLRDEACPVCFPPETLVRTRQGWVPIASIEPGDLVLSKGGVWRTVLEVMERPYDGALVEMDVRSAPEPIRATPEHPFWAMKGNHLGRQSKCSVARCAPMGATHEVAKGRWGSGTITHSMDWVEAGEITRGMFLGSNHPIEEAPAPTTVTIPEHYRSVRVGYNRRSIRKGDTDFALDDDFLWMVGLYLAEGSKGQRSINFALHSKEFEYRDRLIGFFERHGYRVGIQTRPTSKGIWVEVYSSMLSEWLPDWLGHSCDTKAIPQILMDLPVDRLGVVVSGIFDGDGHKDRQILGQTSPVLALQVAEYLMRAGQPMSISAERPDGKRPVYRLNAQATSKASARNWTLDGTRLAEVRGVRLVPYAGMVYNLRVAGDPSYTVQNILVHNCGETEAYNGNDCAVCGFIKPPDAFLDPDVEKAKEVNLRQDQQDAGQAPAAPSPATLQCDNCGATFGGSGEATAPGTAKPAAPSAGGGLERFKVAGFAEDNAAAFGLTTDRWVPKTRADQWPPGTRVKVTTENGGMVEGVITYPLLKNPYGAPLAYERCLLTPDTGAPIDIPVGRIRTVEKIGKVASVSKGGTPSPELTIAWQKRDGWRPEDGPRDENYADGYWVAELTGPEPIDRIEGWVHDHTAFGRPQFSWEVDGSPSWSDTMDLHAAGNASTEVEAKQAAERAIRDAFEQWWADYDDTPTPKGPPGGFPWDHRAAKAAVCPTCNSEKDHPRFRIGRGTCHDPFHSKAKQGALPAPTSDGDPVDEDPTSTAPKAGDACPECGEGTLHPVEAAPSPDEGTPTPPVEAPVESGGVSDEAPADGEGDPKAEKPEESNPEEKPSEDEDDEDDDANPKAPKDTSKGQKESKTMRPTLRRLAEQQVMIETLGEGLDSIASAAGLDLTPLKQRAASRLQALAQGAEGIPDGPVVQEDAQVFAVVAATRKVADEQNPANPIPEPAAQAPVVTTEQAKTPQATTDVTTPAIGAEVATEGVKPDANTSLQDAATVLDQPLDLNEVDVTAPVQGTQTNDGAHKVETEIKSNVDNPPTDGPAFPLQGPFAQPAKVTGSVEPSEGRTFASIRLARLRIQAGIVPAQDDLVLATAIAKDASISDEAIASETNTLSQVLAAQPQAQPVRPVARRLVPQAAAAGVQVQERAVPSLVTAAAADPVGGPSNQAVTADEVDALW